MSLAATVAAPDAGLSGFVKPGSEGRLQVDLGPDARAVEGEGPALRMAVAGRVYNRRPLGEELRLPASTSDGALLRAAYRRWGREAPARVHGDWAFAAWHPEERRLFLARDHSGISSIHYCLDGAGLRFHTTLGGLLDHLPRQTAIDELYLGQLLISWPGYHGERTPYRQLRRLPPSHWLEWMPERCRLQRYWRLEDVAELRLARRQDYLPAFRAVFDEAVASRLEGVEQAGATLSGGLDSGSVVATAAACLRARGGKTLKTYTSIPAHPLPALGPASFADESDYAQATAAQAGHVEVRLFTAAGETPIAAIRRGLEIHREPVHAAGSAYWLQTLLAMARDDGCQIVLTGQEGNGGISWTGDLLSQPLGHVLSRLRLHGWLRARLRQAAPLALHKAWRRWRARPDWYRSSAIHPAFAERLQLRELRLEDAWERRGLPPREQRLAILRPGTSLLGARWAAMGAAFGLRVCDPTADARVLAFMLSVPDAVFIDPASGQDRWLLRAAMQDRLPDSVRLNRRRGLQSGDLVQRLCSSADEVEQALQDCARGPGSEYVDVPYLRATWAQLRAQDSPDSFNKAVAILTRGIMAALWVNRVYAAAGGQGRA